MRAVLGLDSDAAALAPAYIEATFPGLLAGYRTDP